MTVFTTLPNGCIEHLDLSARGDGCRPRLIQFQSKGLDGRVSLIPINCANPLARFGWGQAATDGERLRLAFSLLCLSEVEKFSYERLDDFAARFVARLPERWTVSDDRIRKWLAEHSRVGK